jgi:hypothetical protein
MLMTIKAGAELDLASADELKSATDRILGAMPGVEPRPIYLTRSDAEISTGGFVRLELGSPPVGSIWQLRFITTFGNDDHTAVGGITVAVYCGNPANLALSQLKLTGMAIPSVTFVPDTCMWCHPSETLIVQTSAVVTAGQQVGAIIGIEEWLQKDVSRLSGAGSL